MIAEPDESNILKWHYAIRGPSETPYDGGIYIGKLVFPSEYPMKPPGVMMLTPSGRFKVNTRICMSMSDFHPESWNPMWSVAKIIQGVQSFMASDELTTGGLKASASERKKLAALSMEYNQKMFPKLFDGDLDNAFAEADEASAAAEKKAAATATENSTSGRSQRQRGRRGKRDKAIPQEQGAHESETTDGKGTEVRKSSEPTKELTEEEIEKRRKRNAKKRAKQKSKKATGQENTEEIEENEDEKR